MSYPQQPVQVFVQAPETNGLGTAGFIVSLVSFFLCGLSSPIGLLMSGLALFKRPRGMAIAGTILGLLGSAWLFIGGFAILAGFAALIFGASEASRAVHEQIQNEAMATPVAVDPEPFVAEPQSIGEAPVAEPVLPASEAPQQVENPIAEPASEPITSTNPPPSTLRTWSSADGKFTVEAEFVSATKESVKLKRKDNGALVTVPRSTLAEGDREWLDLQGH